MVSIEDSTSWDGDRYTPELKSWYDEIGFNIPRMSIPLKAVFCHEDSDTKGQSRHLDAVSTIESWLEAGLAYKGQQYENIIETKTLGNL